MGNMKKWIPLLVIAALMILTYFLGLTKYLTFDTLKAHRHMLLDEVSLHWFLAPFLFIILYTISTSLSLPTGLLLSLTGGFLFPQPFSTLYVLAGATLGASIFFLATKTALGDFLRKKAGPRLQKIRKEFQESGTNYLLFLRLVPIFPFWLVNIAPAFLGVPLRTFVWTTFVGIIPGTFVFTQTGAGLGAILDSGEDFSLNTILNRQMKIALIALGLFALIPIIIKKIRKKHDR